MIFSNFAWTGRIVEAGNIADETLRAIRRILRKTTDHSRQLARQSGLTVPQVLCLRFIAKAQPEDEVTVAMVSQAVQLAPATVSRILDRLEDAGLVLRERRSQDRRKVCLSLTDLGRRHVETLPIPLQEQFVRRLQSLSDDEQQRLLGALQKVVEMMEATDVDAAPMLAGEEQAAD